MSAHRDEHLDLCAGYALGVLDEADRRALETHLAEGCAICDAELARHGTSVERLAALAPAVTPPPALRARVLAAALAEGPAKATAPEGRGRVLALPRRRPRVLTWAWASAAALLAVSTFALTRDVATLKSELATTQQRLADARRTLALVNAPDAAVVELSLTADGAKTLRARATFDRRTHRAVIVLANATPPAGRDYQLWVIGPKGPTSLGLVHADSGGDAVAEIPDLGDPSQIQAFAVSLEAEGGSPDAHAPRGPVVMLGKLPG